MSKNYIFRPRARLLLQLGDQLIRNGVIALTELIKNSYDADASFVSIEMINIEEDANKKTLFDPSIIIKDDGFGMNIDTIRNSWLEIGSDEKEKQFKAKIVSPLFNRLPIGEKGIGRFGAHKLGNVIELVSKKKGFKEVVVKIDWRSFEKEKYLEDVPISVIERDSEVFLDDSTGTKITIKDLKTSWNKTKVKEVYHSLNSLVAPFSAKDTFKFEFSINNKNWLDDIFSFDKIKEYALFYFKGKMIGNELEEFTYKFMPYDAFKHKIQEREVGITEEVIKSDLKLPKNFEENAVGTVEVEGYIFDFDNEITHFIPDKRGFKSYLKANSGVKVYRDGLRVYNYGEPDDDWLGLNQRRINRYGKGINKNILLGKVELKRECSTGLVEKTNREGFIENEAYNALVENMLFYFSKIEYLRLIDKTNLRSLLGFNKKFQEPVTGNISKLRGLIDNKVDENQGKKELLTCVNQIESDYKEIKNTLVSSASYGVNHSIVIHEVEKSLKLLNGAVKEGKDPQEVKVLVEQLSEIMEAHTNLLKVGNPQKDTLNKIFKELKLATKLRVKRHGVDFILEENSLGKRKINCSKKYVENMLMNLVDNSIYWLDASNNKNKKIKISLSDEIEGYISFIVSDNGPGFKIPEEEAKILFATTKSGGEGIGLGLYVTDQIITQHEGLLIIDESKDLIEVEEEFKKGATLCLCFKELID